MIVFTNTTDDIKNAISELKNTQFYQSRSRTLIILEKGSTVEALTKVFKYFWDIKYPNVAIMFKSELLLKIFTSNPFFGNKNFLEDMSHESVKELFYNKFRDINGKKLKVMLLKYDDRDKIILKKHPNGTLEWSGFEISLLRCLVSKLNGTPIIISGASLLKPEERDPWRQTNNLSFNGGITKRRIIEENSIDLMTSEEIILREDLRGVTEGLYTHATDDLKILIRRKPQVQYYRYIFLVFSKEIWFLTIGSFIIGAFTWWFISKGQFIENKFLNLLRILMGSSIPKLPYDNSERIFISFWLLCALIIITAFTSNLTTVLMSDKYDPNYNTIDELNDAGIIAFAFETKKRELLQAFNGTQKYPFFQRLIPVPKKYDHNNNTLNNYTQLLFDLKTDQPMLLNERRGIYVTKHRIFMNMFHIVKESPLPNYTAYQLPIGKYFFHNIKQSLN